MWTCPQEFQSQRRFLGCLHPQESKVLKAQSPETLGGSCGHHAAPGDSLLSPGRALLLLRLSSLGLTSALRRNCRLLLCAATCPTDRLGNWEARGPGKGRTRSPPRSCWTRMQSLLRAEGRQSLQRSRATLVVPSEPNQRAQ